MWQNTNRHGGKVDHHLCLAGTSVGNMVRKESKWKEKKKDVLNKKQGKLISSSEEYKADLDLRKIQYII